MTEPLTLQGPSGRLASRWGGAHPDDELKRKPSAEKYGAEIEALYQ